MFFYAPQMPSTMDEAWKRAEAGAVSGTMVLADRQSAGRGQHGRVWASPPGGLYMTLVLRPELPLSHAGALVLETAAAVCRIVNAGTGRDLEYRWPNDLMLDGRKVGGLLVEASGSPERVRFFTLGIGLNVKPVELAERKTAGIDEMSQHRLKRREIASALRSAMRNWCTEPVLRPDAWYRGYRGAHKPVHGTHWSGRGFAGSVQGFTAQGGLVLNTETISMGETRLVRFEGEEG
jgi:biotin-[acetyl-CoA-carboxylase] ligase BirA-like protein